MRLYGNFEEKGYQVRAYLPDGPAEGIAWKVEISEGEKILHEFRIPMIYEPRFGPDSNDVAQLEAVTDDVLGLLPEPRKFDDQTIKRIDEIVAKAS